MRRTEYVLKEGALPVKKHLALLGPAWQQRILPTRQKERKSETASGATTMTCAVPESLGLGKSFKELLADAREERYARS